MQQHGSKYFARRAPSSFDPRVWGQKVEIQLFQNMVMLHIKFNGITKCNNMVANILSADPSLPTTILGDGARRSKFIFSEHGHVAYQTKGIHKMQQQCSKHFARRSHPPHLPTLGMESISQNSTLSENGCVAYQIKLNHEMQQHGSKYFACRPPST